MSTETRDFNRCNICKKGYTDIKKVINCSRCKLTYCMVCTVLTPSKLATLKDVSSGAQWFCCHCLGGAMKLLQADMDIEQLCRDRMEKMEKRISELSLKVNEKADKSDVLEMGKRIDKIEQDIVDKASHPLSDSLKDQLADIKMSVQSEIKATIADTVTQEMNEMKEVERRKVNIMLYGLEEKATGDKDADAMSDLREITDFITSDLNVRDVTITKCYRVGKRIRQDDIQGAASATANPVQSRAIKVIFGSKRDKDQVMVAFWAKKNKKEKLKYGMANDYTKHENEVYQKLKKELKIRQEKGEQDLTIKRLKIVKKK